MPHLQGKDMKLAHYFLLKSTLLYAKTIGVQDGGLAALLPIVCKYTVLRVFGNRL